jgi:hypothetical protein
MINAVVIYYFGAFCQSDDNIGFAGSSKNFAAMADFRLPPHQLARKFENDVMINALYAFCSALCSHYTTKKRQGYRFKFVLCHVRACCDSHHGALLFYPDTCTATGSS